MKNEVLMSAITGLGSLTEKAALKILRWKHDISDTIKAIWTPSSILGRATGSIAAGTILGEA